MLAAMGVQVWYQRRDLVEQTPSETRLSDVPCVPEAQATPKAAAEIIEFAWVKGQTGMLMCDLAADAVTLQLVKDIVRFGDFARGLTEAVTPVENVFRWPQLADTGGTPLRALTVFIDKHLPKQGAWVALTAEVVPSVAKWLKELPLTVIELPALQPNIGDAATKKMIWQSLRTDT